MNICNRCNKEITRINSRSEKLITTYKSSTTYTGQNVHLCYDCLCELNKFIGKAESYFMITKEPSNIFNDVKYWTDN